MKIPELVKLFFGRLMYRMYRGSNLGVCFVTLLMVFSIGGSILLTVSSFLLLFPVLHIHNNMLPDSLYKLNISWLHILPMFILGVIFGAFAIMQMMAILQDWHKKLLKYIPENRKTVLQRANKTLEELKDDKFKEGLILLITELSSCEDELVYVKAKELEGWLNKYGEWEYSLYKIERQKEASKKILHELA